MRALQAKLGKTTYSVIDGGTTVTIKREHPSDRYPTEIHVPRKLLLQWALAQPLGEILRTIVDYRL